MSERDKRLLKSMGMQVTEAAAALGLSRQYVSTQINKRDFFNQHYLIRLALYVKENKPEKYGLFISLVEEYFPECSDVVSKVVEGPFLGSTIIKCNREEFWFILGDFDSFYSNKYVKKQLSFVVKNGCSLVVISLSRNVNLIQEAIKLFKEEMNIDRDIEVIACPVDERIMKVLPSVLLQLTGDGVKMYGVSEHGFVPLSSKEGEKIRDVFSRAMGKKKIEKSKS